MPALIRPRRFWPSVIWLAFLAAGAAFSCVFGLFALFTAVMVAAFIGLNEFGRWTYKTNLVLCTAAAAVVAVAGTFKWTEIAALFVLFFAVSAWLLYFRDKAGRLIPVMDAFASSLARAEDFDAIVESAWSGVQEMAPDAAVFIVLADIDGALYLPDHFGERGRALKRNGGTLWKVFASGRPMIVPRISAGRDQPLDREAVSLVSVPIMARGEKLGALQLEAGTAGAFTDEDAAKLSLAAMVIGHELSMFEASCEREKDDGDDTD